MNIPVASTGWWPSQPPRTTMACLVEFVTVIGPFVEKWGSGCRHRSCPDGRAHAGPATLRRGALLDGGQHLLNLQRVLERRARLFTGGKAAHEVRDLVREQVVVPEPMTCLLYTSPSPR